MPRNGESSKTAEQLVAECMRSIVALEAARYLIHTRRLDAMTTPRDIYPLTPEDEAIVYARMDCVTDEAYMQADRIDARAMMAIEIDRAWRYRDDPAEYKRNPGTPADRVELWGDQGLRLEIEAMAGEKLL